MYTCSFIFWLTQSELNLLVQTHFLLVLYLYIYIHVHISFAGEITLLGQSIHICCLNPNVVLNRPHLGMQLHLW